METSRSLQKVFLLLAATAMLVAAELAGAAQPARQGAALLAATYERNLERLEHSSFGLPLFLESMQHDGRVQVDVYGILESAFAGVAQVLTVPADWCDIVSLHLNVKACTYRQQSTAWLLTFYLGRKFYQPPSEAYEVIYHFQRVVEQQDYLDILLQAAAGPLGTEDHRLRFEALALPGDRTFLHVGYAFSQGLVLRLAQKLYFATLAEDKVGFTVLGSDDQGRAIFTSGARGATERNAVRYYFAIQAFMETLSEREESRFRSRLSRWYDLTARYPRQLYEMDKADYLAAKTKEHNNQLLLQRQLGTTP